MRWQVRQLDDGDWGIRRGNDWWHEIFPTFQEAIIWAERYAAIDLIMDGYLTRVGELKRWLNAGYK